MSHQGDPSLGGEAPMFTAMNLNDISLWWEVCTLEVNTINFEESTVRPEGADHQ